MSPTAVARLSANMDRESSRQSDCGSATTGRRIRPAMASCRRQFILEGDENGLLIENLSANVASRLHIAGADDLARRAVFQRFNFHGYAEISVLHQRVGRLAAADHRAGFDGAGEQG